MSKILITVVGRVVNVEEKPDSPYKSEDINQE